MKLVTVSSSVTYAFYIVLTGRNLGLYSPLRRCLPSMAKPPNFYYSGILCNHVLASYHTSIHPLTFFSISCMLSDIVSLWHNWRRNQPSYRFFKCTRKGISIGDVCHETLRCEGWLNTPCSGSSTGDFCTTAVVMSQPRALVLARRRVCRMPFPTTAREGFSTSIYDATRIACATQRRMMQTNK